LSHTAVPGEAQAQGVVRLPSLVVGGKVMRIEDHSPIEHVQEGRMNDDTDPAAAWAAPPLRASRWLNTTSPLVLSQLRGKVVMLHAFQMLCPGCISHGLPQAQRVHDAFDADDVVVIGLHTVFEHHAVMGRQALEVFVHEYRWSFPIGIDDAVDGATVPATMQAYQWRGTPSLTLIDRQGFVRLHHFGAIDDLALGHALGRLQSVDRHAAHPAPSRP
jgi:thiol-disulfide isomerase/thioredoxin